MSLFAGAVRVEPAFLSHTTASRFYHDSGVLALPTASAWFCSCGLTSAHCTLFRRFP
jgi:hypothetical protein